MNPDQIWQTTLDQLELQMTSATFNTWLLRTHLLAFEDDVATVGVHNSYALDWLENRLQTMITQTLAQVCGRPIRVRFVVFNTELQSAPAETEAEAAVQDQQDKPFVAPEFDWRGVGWFPVSEYESRFWAPVLGRIAWRIWEIVRETDHRKQKDVWTPERRWSAPELAEMVPCSRHSVTGVIRQSGEQRGALKRLCDLDLARMTKQAKIERDPHTIYVLSVRVRMPLLIPVFATELPDRLQCLHDAWLGDHGLDPKDWFLTT
jgi:hypothetical protein